MQTEHVNRRGIERLIDLEGKTALVSGGGRGIGKTIALYYAQAGAAVTIIARSAAELEASAREIEEKTGRKAGFIAADVCDLSQVDRVFQAIERDCGSLDVLVNAAGTAAQVPAQDFNAGVFERVYGLNCRGLFYMCGKAYPLMLKTGRGGKIINIASHLGAVGLPLRTVYCSSKAAVIHYTKTLAAEWARDRINVNSIAPGYTVTELSGKVLSDPEFKQEVLSKTPLGFIGETGDIAGAALFLASEASRYMTGQTMIIDGGWSCV
jgi:NAD(P)-dependent dehydrogenase (short-subunit alcohol dehydrogenase family)